MDQYGENTGLSAFRQRWWAGSQPLGFPSFIQPTGPNTTGQGDQGAQAQAMMMQGLRARMRVQQMQTADPDVAQHLQRAWAAEDQGAQPQSPSAMMQAMQGRMRAQQMQGADPDVAGNLQAMWAAQDRAGG